MTRRLLKPIRVLLTLAGFAVCLSLTQRLYAAESYAFSQFDPLTQPGRVSVFREAEEHGIRCVTEDRKGRLWFGLNQGVACYDGLHWKFFGIDDGLPDARIRTIAARHDGTIAAGSQVGIHIYRQNAWQPAWPSAVEQPFSVYHLLEGSDATLWACGPWGVLAIDESERRLFSSAVDRQYVSSLIPADTFVPIPEEHLATDRWGTLTGARVMAEVVVTVRPGSPAEAAGIRIGDLITSGGNLSASLREDASPLLNLTVHRQGQSQPEPLQLQTQSDGTLAKSPSTRFLCEGQHGQIWLGSTRGTIIRMSRATGARSTPQWTSWTSDDGLRVGSRPRILAAADGTVWAISTTPPGEVMRFDGEAWSSPRPSNGEDKDVLSSITQTADGTVWVAGSKYLRAYRDGQDSVHLTRAAGLPEFRPFLLAKSDGSLWISGENQFTARIALPPHDWTSVENVRFQTRDRDGAAWFIENKSTRIVRWDGSRATVFDGEDGMIDRPRGIFTTAGGVLVVGSDDSMAALSRYDGRAWHKQSFPELANSLSGRAGWIGDDDTIWLSASTSRRGDQQGGLVVFDGNGWSHLKSPLAPRNAKFITRLADGQMMVAGIDGVRLFDGADWTAPENKLARDAVCIGGAIDSRDGSVWIGTRQAGVLRYRNNVWDRFDRTMGLASNNIIDLAFPQGGLLWVSTTNGLFRFDGSRFIRATLPIAVSGPQLVPDLEGSLWIAGQHRFAPDRDPPDSFVSVVPGKHTRGAPLEMSWNGVDQWNVTPPDQLTWSWRVGDGPWSEFLAVHRHRIDDLPTGQQRIEVRARDAYFNVDPTPAWTTINVVPPIWRSGWFLAIAGGMLGLVVWQSARIVKQGFALRKTNASLDEARGELATQYAIKSAQFRSICDNSPFGVFACDEVGQARYFNQQLAEMLGVESHESLGDLWAESVHPDDRERIAAAWTKTVTDGAPFTFHGRFQHRDGTIVWFEAKAEPICSNNELVGYVGGIRDITNERAANRELAESEERFRSIFEGAASGMALQDLDGNYIRVNRAFQDIVGYSNHELIGRSYQQITHPDDLDAGKRLDEALLGGQKPWHQSREKRYIHKDGRDVWVLASASLMPNANSEPTLRIVNVQDISDLKLAEKDREQRMRHLYLISRANDIMDATESLGGMLNEILDEFTTGLRCEAGWVAVTSDDSPGQFDTIAETVTISSLPKASDHVASALSNEAHACTAAAFTANVSTATPASSSGGMPSGDILVTQQERVLLTLLRPGPGTASTWALGLERSESSAPWELPDHWLLQDLGHRLEDAITAIQLRQSVYESEHRYRTIVETADEGIFTVNRAGRITFANPAMSAMLGRDVSALRGSHFIDLVDPSQRALAEEKFAARLTGQAGQLECQMTRKNGEHVWVKCSSSPLVDKDGEIVGMLGMLTDITARKLAEKQQADYQRALITVDGHAQDLATTIGESALFFRTVCAAIGELVNADQTAVALITEDGDSVRLIETIGSHATQAPGHVLSLDQHDVHRRVIETGSSIRVDDATAVGDAPRTINAMIVLPLESGAKVVGTLSASREGEEFQQFEQNLLELYSRSVSASYDNMRLLQSLERHVAERTSELHERNAELDDFAHSVSHDLRAPLRALSGFALALREDYGNRLDETGIGYLQHIADAGERMDSLIGDLLEYSRLGRTELCTSPMNLNTTMVEARQNLVTEIQRSGACIHVDLPLPSVMGHSATVLQIVSNLLLNAMKFVSPGEACVIRVWAEERGKAIRLWIEDNGIGIEAEFHDRIFSTFERLHGVETYPGTGIGLAIVSRGCRRLGGSCGVESTPGVGSRFWIELPKED